MSARPSTRSISGLGEVSSTAAELLGHIFAHIAESRIPIKRRRVMNEYELARSGTQDLRKELLRTATKK